MKTGEKAPAPKMPKAKIRTKASAPAGYYSTGPSQTKVIKQAGKTVRMGPNSTMAPTPAAGWGAKLKSIWDILRGGGPSSGSNMTGVRG